MRVHMNNKFMLVVVCGAVTLLQGGCDSSTTPTADIRTEEERVAPQTGTPLTLDDQFAVIAEEIEGFGGLFLDASGEVNVYLKDPSRADLAVKVLSTKFAHVLGEHAASKRLDGMQIHEGNYDFLELRAWRDLSIGLMALDGAVSYDIDESENVLRIGVEGQNDIPEFEKVMATHGIPTDAFIVEESEKPVFRDRLTDHVRPLKGGLETTYSSGSCTFGFNVIRGTEYGFVTNSHCTEVQGEVDGRTFFQDKTSKPSHRLGSETVDPPFYIGSGAGKTMIPHCPMPCRQSDAAYIKYDDNISNNDIQFGRIARTASRSPTNGSTLINGTFLMTGEASSHILGQEVNKIGRTTGWTYGSITHTCVTYIVPSGDKILVCQYRANAGMDDGDSGSPVFSWSGNGSNVTLYGLAWGSLSSNLVYSPISSVNYELGTDPINP